MTCVLMALMALAAMAQNERFGRALLSKGAEDQRAHLQRGCERW